MEIFRGSIKYIFIFFVYIVFIIAFIYFCNTKNRESYDNMLIKKIKLFNWWNMPQDEPMIMFLRRLISDEILEKYREVHFYSVFGEVKFERSPDILYIQYSGESYYNDPEKYDINLIPNDKMEKNEENNTVLMPHGCFQIYSTGMEMNYFLNKRALIYKKEKFSKLKNYI